MGGNEVVNKDDLHDVRDTLSEQIQHGFTGITARLDVLNGRVGKGEVVDAELRVRVENLERDVREKRSAPPVEGAAIEEQAAITRRDLKVAVAVLSAMYVLAQIAFKVAPVVAKLVQP
jgi:hypothetical protein